jgi:hypothetical protein
MLPIRNSRRRIALASAATLGLIAGVATAAPAAAAPTNPAGQDERRLLLQCPGYDDMVLLTPRAYGPLPAGFLIESHALVIPYVLDLQTPGGPVLEAKNAPLPGDAITCTISPYGGTQVSGTAIVAIKGQPLS